MDPSQSCYSTLAQALLRRLKRPCRSSFKLQLLLSKPVAPPLTTALWHSTVALHSDTALCTAFGHCILALPYGTPLWHCILALHWQTHLLQRGPVCKHSMHMSSSCNVAIALVCACAHACQHYSSCEVHFWP